MPRVLNKKSIFHGSCFEDLDSFTDACLKTEDGQAYRVHKVVLASKSLYFKTLFSGAYNDGNDILLQGIQSKILYDILRYLYSGHVSLKADNVLDVLLAADYFMVESLLERCRVYALETMTIKNCVPILMAAWKVDGLKWFGQCYRFVQMHFEEIFRLCPESISQLPEELLLKLVQDRNVNVSSEMTVWNAIGRWMQNNPVDRIGVFLNSICFEELDSDMCNAIVNHPLIRQYFTSRDFNSSAKSVFRRNEERLPERVYFFVKYGDGQPSVYGYNLTEMYISYDDKLDYCRKLGDIEFFPDTVIQIGFRVYLFDMWDSDYLVYNLIDGTFEPVTPTTISRCRHVVVLAGDKIYITGGIADTVTENEIMERFDPELNVWSQVRSMQPMVLCDAVAIDNDIYVIGDVKGDTNPTMVVQKYDAKSDEWSYSVAPSTFRYNFAAIVYDRELYIIGGQNHHDVYVSIVEKYTPGKDQWLMLPNLPCTYILPKAIVFKDRLMVFDNIAAETSHYDMNPNPVYWDVGSRTWMPVEEPYRNVHCYRFVAIEDREILREIIRRNRYPGAAWTGNGLV